MVLSLPVDYHEPPVLGLSSDLSVASTVGGVTIGIGIFTAGEAILQSRISSRPLHSSFIWLIWLELIANAAILCICYALLNHAIKPSFGTLFGILVLWTVELQLILQIILNRIILITGTLPWPRRLRWIVAGLVGIINITVWCIWIPARMQIKDTYIHLNEVYDRVEKGMYLIIDACLNVYFINIVKRYLVRNGLSKYNRLAKLNMILIFISLTMDVAVIGSMSFHNSYVYMVFHPLAFVVKLRIELFMAKLIRKLALEGMRTVPHFFPNDPDLESGAVRNDDVSIIAVGSSTRVDGLEDVDNSRPRGRPFSRALGPSCSGSLLSSINIIDARDRSRISSRSSSLGRVESYSTRRPGVDTKTHDSGFTSSECELERVCVDLNRRDMADRDTQAPRTPPEAVLHDEIN